MILGKEKIRKNGEGGEGKVRRGRGEKERDEGPVWWPGAESSKSLEILPSI